MCRVPSWRWISWILQLSVACSSTKQLCSIHVYQLYKVADALLILHICIHSLFWVSHFPSLLSFLIDLRSSTLSLHAVKYKCLFLFQFHRLSYFLSTVFSAYFGRTTFLSLQGTSPSVIKSFELRYIIWCHSDYDYCISCCNVCLCMTACFFPPPKTDAVSNPAEGHIYLNLLPPLRRQVDEINIVET